ncbi:MAG: SUMF1/EgtB/PvdO family nonheme iron enzyme [Nitrospira sp. CR1.1]|nr:SUMF1/EgtB/PvdO family nonheme iron enzyme [Nitrospira sp. CR1.1]
MIRGGSWNNEPINVRSANRNRNTPTNRNDNIGFRCAQDAHPTVGVRIFMGKVRSAPLGVQTDPGLVRSTAGQPKNAPPVSRAGQVIRSLVQGRSEVGRIASCHGAATVIAHLEKPCGASIGKF